MDDSASPLSELLSRRRVLAAGGSTLAAVLAGCSSGSNDQAATDTPGSSTSDTPGTDTTTPSESPITGTHRLLGANMARTSAAPDETGPTAKPSVEWHYSTDPSGSVPVVVDGRVYHASGRGETLHAIDAATGEKRWSKSVGKYPTSPTVVDGVVYVAGKTSVRSYDAASGAEQWSRSIPGAEYASWGSPVVVDGTVYVSDQSNLLALDAESGTTQWRTAGSGCRSPAVVDGVVYGWETKADGKYESGGGKTVALDAATGEPVWTADGAYVGTEDGDRTPVAVKDGRMFTPSPNGMLTAVDAANGDRLWVKEVIPGETTGSIREPAAVDGVVLAPAGGPKGNIGRVRAFDAATGDERWIAEPSGGVTSGVVADGVYYGGIATQTGGGVFALGVEDGKKRWSISRPVVGGVVPVDGGLLTMEYRKGVSLLR